MMVDIPHPLIVRALSGDATEELGRWVRDELRKHYVLVNVGDRGPELHR